MKSISIYASLAAMGLLVLARPASVNAAPDAVSAASLVPEAINITETTVTINITHDRYDYGNRVLCYDPAPAAAKNNCITKTVNSKLYQFNVTGLKAGTAYNYNVNAIDTRDGERPYNTSGTFTTKAAATAIMPGELKGRNKAQPITSIDALGRSYRIQDMRKEMRRMHLIR